MRFRAPSVIAGIGLLAVISAAASPRVDHSKFPQLKGPFKSGVEVTKVCLTCHSQVGEDLLTTSHWLWQGEPTAIPGHPGQTHAIGKANVINNFCIGIQSNEASCTRCHIGYGWVDKTFNFKDPTKIDCLVCHDATASYTRQPLADEPLNWALIAQNVGKTSVQTCGSCHFNGGGGEGVKHGDLDPSLLEPNRELDIHLDLKGLGFTCSTCHKGEEIPHHIRGRSASVSVHEGDELSCASCHGEAPHGKPFIYRTAKEKKAGEIFHQEKPSRPQKESDRLNWHARKIACQTCHIPRYATVMPTKIWWDWSKAGRLDDKGAPIQEINADGDITYMGIKGEFRWAKNLIPEYRWTNGTNERYLLGDKFDPTKVLVLNRPLGSPNDPSSKIAPYKIMRGKQIFDTTNNYLIQPHLSGEKGSGAYWKDFDWDKAARVGMAYANLPYSGHYGFAETEMYWPLSHMTQEGTKTVSCAECHSRDGRLKKIEGVYIPGQHRFLWLDWAGWSAVALALLGVLLHGFFRWWGPKGDKWRQRIFGKDGESR